MDDINAAIEGRDKGIARVMENSTEEWKAAVYNYILALPEGWTGTGEDIRVACPLSHAPQAWGAIINTAVRRNWLQPTGQYKMMRSSASHGRETRVYARTDLAA